MATRNKPGNKQDEHSVEVGLFSLLYVIYLFIMYLLKIIAGFCYLSCSCHFLTTCQNLSVFFPSTWIVITVALLNM